MHIDQNKVAYRFDTHQLLVDAQTWHTSIDTKSHIDFTHTNS
jgi:hypothetical protein